MKRLATVALLMLFGAAFVFADEPAPVGVSVGASVNLCKAELTVCPVSTFACDDPKVAVVENGPEGAVVKGISPGTTLCVVFGHERAFRHVVRVTVTQ
jgi:hypothetical protein